MCTWFWNTSLRGGFASWNSLFMKFTWLFKKEKGNSMYQSKMHVWRQIALNVSRMVYFWWKTSLVLQTQQVCCTQHQSCVNFACNMMKFGSKLTKISSENNKLDVFSLTMKVFQTTDLEQPTVKVVKSSSATIQTCT